MNRTQDVQEPVKSDKKKSVWLLSGLAALCIGYFVVRLLLPMNLNGTWVSYEGYAESRNGKTPTVPIPSIYEMTVTFYGSNRFTMTSDNLNFEGTYEIDNRYLTFIDRRSTLKVPFEYYKMSETFKVVLYDSLNIFFARK